MLSRTRKAFTMLELIVVIVILGILAAIAIPTFRAVIEKTRANSVKQTGMSLGRETVALDSYNEDRDGTTLETAFDAAKVDLTASGYTVDANLTGAGVVLGTSTRTFGITKYAHTATVTLVLDSNSVSATVS